MFSKLQDTIERFWIAKVNEMCAHSLSPHEFETWEMVKYWLIKTRKL